MKNKKGQEIKEVSAGDFVALFSPRVHDVILTKAEMLGVVAMACFECEPKEGDEYGHRVAVPIGSGRLFQEIGDLEGAEVEGADFARFPVCYWRIG